MLGDITVAENIYIACGYTDMRKSIDGLAAIVQQQFRLDPFSNTLFLFCGRHRNRMKALLWEGDGFILLYKRLENGSFKWPRSEAELKPITWQQFRWLVFSVGVTPEEYYQNGEILKIAGTYINISELQIAPNEIKENIIIENDEIKKYQNIAFFITDGQCRCTSIISLNSETSELKMVSIPRKLYLNIGDKYGQYYRAYIKGDVEQAIRTLNTNLDMNIQDFIAIDLKTFSEFVDALGGVWIDVQSINATNYSGYIMSVLEIEEPIVLNEGYQLLNGDQVATYCWYLGTNNILDSQLSDVFIAIHKQMQSVDNATLQQAINVYMSNVYTSIDAEVISDGMRNVADYNYSEIGGVGFPQEGMRELIRNGVGDSDIVPVDLESNVIWLHEFLFGQEGYEVSETVKEYSLQIKENVAQYSQ